MHKRHPLQLTQTKQGQVSLVLKARCPACFRCFPALTHLIQIIAVQQTLGNQPKHAGQSALRIRVVELCSGRMKEKVQMQISACGHVPTLHHSEMVWNGVFTHSHQHIKCYTLGKCHTWCVQVWHFSTLKYGNMVVAAPTSAGTGNWREDGDEHRTILEEKRVRSTLLQDNDPECEASGKI